jgi:MEMO1 family protein
MRKCELFVFQKPYYLKCVIKPLFCFILLLFSCGVVAQTKKTRPLADTIGFASKAWQMDSVMKRIERLQGSKLKIKTTAAKAVICPHDDYSYTGYMYPLTVKNIKAKTILMFGVAHRARKYGIENKIIFDSYSHWRAPYGEIKISALRQEIISTLPKDIYEINDTLQKLEHSVEGIVPFLQYYNKNCEIISILVPAMPFARMDSLSKILANTLHALMKNKNLKWGEDIAIVISNDAVHYGDEEWGGKNFARYGTDSAGNEKAVRFEKELIAKTLEGKLTKEKIKTFTEETVMQDNFRDYNWTWCGRFSVPFGLLCSMHLQKNGSKKLLNGKLLDYTTSIKNTHVPVKDLQMGVTAPAFKKHWVGYASMKFD